MYLDLAKKIPDKVRTERLMVQPDPIETAQAVATNKNMQLLFAVYNTFVYPNKYEDDDIQCWKCRQQVLHCFQSMRPHLIALEREHLLLQAIK